MIPKSELERIAVGERDFDEITYDPPQSALAAELLEARAVIELTVAGLAGVQKSRGDIPDSEAWGAIGAALTMLREVGRA